MWNCSHVPSNWRVEPNACGVTSTIPTANSKLWSGQLWSTSSRNRICACLGPSMTLTWTLWMLHWSQMITSSMSSKFDDTVHDFSHNNLEVWQEIKRRKNLCRVNFRVTLFAADHWNSSFLFPSLSVMLQTDSITYYLYCEFDHETSVNDVLRLVRTYVRIVFETASNAKCAVIWVTISRWSVCLTKLYRYSVMKSKCSRSLKRIVLENVWHLFNNIREELVRNVSATLRWLAVRPIYRLSILQHVGYWAWRFWHHCRKIAPGSNEHIFWSELKHDIEQFWLLGLLHPCSNVVSCCDKWSHLFCSNVCRKRKRDKTEHNVR